MSVVGGLVGAVGRGAVGVKAKLQDRLCCPSRPWSPGVHHQAGGLQEMLRLWGAGVPGRGRWRSGYSHREWGVPEPLPPCSAPQDVLCTPARRLLQDSQDIAVTVTPLRAERVLLFNDALVLLQVWGS